MNHPKEKVSITFKRWLDEGNYKIAPTQAQPAAQEPVQVDAWQPIETAPKDGSTILLGKSASIDDDRATSTVGFWQKGWEDSFDDVGCDDGFVDVRLQEFSPQQSSGAQQYRSSQPTHWQPLPAPPTSKGQTK